MIKANISKENKQQLIEAVGSVPELINDTTVLIGGIYTQLRNADAVAAELFRAGLIKLLTDKHSPAWKALGNQTGIVFQKPNGEEEK